VSALPRARGATPTAGARLPARPLIPRWHRWRRRATVALREWVLGFPERFRERPRSSESRARLLLTRVPLLLLLAASWALLLYKLVEICLKLPHPLAG
jgi:hypothetical protein